MHLFFKCIYFFNACIVNCLNDHREDEVTAQLVLEYSAVIRRLSAATEQNSKTTQKNWTRTLAPIWFPHWPACKCTISRILDSLVQIYIVEDESVNCLSETRENDGSSGRFFRIRCSASETVYWAKWVVQLYVIVMATKGRRRAGGTGSRGKGGWDVGKAVGVLHIFFLVLTSPRYLKPSSPFAHHRETTKERITSLAVQKW